MKVSKAERERVYAIFDGHCAYCGCKLQKGWHVDHVKAVMRVGGGHALRKDNHNSDNLFPACPPCNLDKGAHGINGYKEWIESHLRSLQRQSNYRSVYRHGLVEETNKPIIFFFEKLANALRVVEKIND